MQQKLKVLNAQLQKAKIEHGVALKQYTEFMEILKNDYGIDDISKTQNHIDKLTAKMGRAENKRNTMLEKAAILLQINNMEDSYGDTEITKQEATQNRSPRDVLRNGTNRSNRGIQKYPTRKINQ